MFKKIGLDKKLILCICVFSLVLLLASSGFSYFMSQSMVVTESDAKMTNMLRAEAGALDLWITDVEVGVKSYGNAIAASGLDKDGVMKVMGSICSEYDGVVYEAYTAYPNRDLFFKQFVDLPADFDATTRTWYKDAVSAKGVPICTSPYIDFITKKMIVTIACAVYNNGELYAVIGADVYIDQLIEKANAISVYTNAYPFLIDGDRNIIIHRSEEYSPRIEGEQSVLTNVADLPAYASLDLASGNVAVQNDYDNVKRTIATAPIASTGWLLGYAVDYSEYSSQLTQLMLTQLLILIPCILIMLLVGIPTLRHFLKPIQSLKAAATGMAEGKLDYRADYFGHDMLGELSANLAETNASLKSYIGDISDNLSKMAAGDFDVHFNANYVGDFASIKKSITEISGSIGSVIEGVSSASTEVTSGAESVSGTASALAEGSSEQTRNIDTMSEIVEKFTAQVNSNSENAGRALEYSDRTSESVTNSNSSMKELLSSMNEIIEKSIQIEKIVKTIDDIAYQTNILALNAAVEAARAGEAGKGFAVVADEVRNLASKSAEAAKGTQELIRSTAEAVSRGSQIADETAKSLEEVTLKSSDVNKLVADISKACHEQSDEIVQINEKLDILAEIARRNAATSEESAASSEELSGQSKILDELIRHFGK